MAVRVARRRVLGARGRPRQGRCPEPQLRVALPLVVGKLDAGLAHGPGELLERQAALARARQQRGDCLEELHGRAAGVEVSGVPVHDLGKRDRLLGNVHLHECVQDLRHVGRELRFEARLGEDGHAVEAAQRARAQGEVHARVRGQHPGVRHGHEARRHGRPPRGEELLQQPAHAGPGEARAEDAVLQVTQREGTVGEGVAAGAVQRGELARAQGRPEGDQGVRHEAVVDVEPAREAGGVRQRARGGARPGPRVVARARAQQRNGVVEGR
mmetsp:Transcript_15452/g.45184  ORF Transcript_15452/g.45184 Transcript_15452/m.45184 type:complete len:270 (-) Transcript_15452:951-1760(-)